MLDTEIEKADDEGYAVLNNLIAAWETCDWKRAEELWKELKPHLDFLVEQS